MTENALHRAPGIAEILFDYAPDAYYLSDLYGRFLDGNRAAEAMTGRSRTELIGMSFLEADLLLHEDLPRAAALLKESTAGRPTGPDEFVLRRKDGAQVTAEICTYPVRIGRSVIVLGIARDLSERKRLEAQLRRSQKMEAVGQLTGGVAHDFNNLLAVIRANVELLLMEPTRLNPANRQCLENLMETTERAANLTRRLLVFSREQPIEARPLGLNDLVKNLTKMLNRLIREDIRLECRFQTRLPCVLADPGMIEQVLLNLVINARDAMPQGGKLCIGTELSRFVEGHKLCNPEARFGEFVCLSVADTGTGIKPEHLPRIFEPFFTTKTEAKGTGLGLATVHGIAKQHQGWVDVESRVGEGTTFRVYIPALNAATVASPSNRPAQTSVRGGTETILLAEDDYGVRMVTRRVLESFNYTVLEAASAREATTIWEKNASEISLLLTDIIMAEGMTGIELAESLRKRRPRLKVIIMSGYNSWLAAKDTELFRTANFHFLRKPSNTSTLLHEVRKCLDEA